MELDRRYVWSLLEYTHVERSPWFERFHWPEEREIRSQLRSSSCLEAELGTLCSEWEQILRIMDWVHTMSEHHGWDAAVDLSAFALLNGANGKSITFRCVEFAYMLRHTLNAFGFPARVLGLKRYNSQDGVGKGHVVAEVWSNEFSKWVVLDPQFNLYYRDRSGRVLSVFELHARVRNRQWNDIVPSKQEELETDYEKSEPMDSKENQNYDTFEVYEGFSREGIWDSLPDHSDYESFRRFWLSYFHQLSFATHSGLVLTPKGLTSHGEYFYYDPQDIPPIVFQKMRTTYTYTSDECRLNFPVNGVEIQWQPDISHTSSSTPIEATRQIVLLLQHAMPWFEHFVIKVNGQSTQHREDTLPLELQLGETAVEVTPVNDCGRLGSMARVVFMVNA